MGALNTWSAILVMGLGTAGMAQAAGQSVAPAAAAKAPAVAKPVDGWAERGARFGGTEWVTRPSRDAAMGFTMAQEIKEILIKSGDRVKAGQVLARAREGELLASIAVQRARSKNDTEVQNAAATLELAQSRFEAATRAKQDEALNQAEFDERRVGLVTAKITLDAAQRRFEEEGLRLVQLEKQAERYRVEAPFDGIIDTVAADVGQTATENQPIIRLVNIDSLWVDVPIPIEQTIELGLTPDHPAWALLDLPGDPVVLTARVLYVSPVADSASQTRRVRIEARNPQLLPAGTRARVRFTAPESTWIIGPVPKAGGER